MSTITKNTTAQSVITHTIATSYDEELFLSRFVETNQLKSVALQLTLKANVSVVIIDDLEIQAMSEGNLEFCLEENAHLTLRMRSIHALYKISTTGYSEVIVPAYHTDFLEQPDAAHCQKECKRTLTLRLLGKQASADVRYACYGANDKRFRFNILQDHQAEGATSNVVVRSVLQDSSQLFCKGLITIRKGAQHTQAELENKNILLGNSARAVSIPTLEIEANDVVCKHGAAISKLDEEQFFYLQSRGIDKALAQTMLVESFLQ